MTEKLDLIKQVLDSFGKTYYGNGTPALTDEWNYTVFRRSEIAKSPNGTDFVRKYTVAVIRENYIPEGLDFEVIQAIQNGTNLRFNSSNYNYVYKGQSDVVVEICLIVFSEPIKRCKVLGE